MVKMMVVDGNDGRGRRREVPLAGEWGGRRLLGPVVSKRLPLIPEQNNKGSECQDPTSQKTPCMK